MILVKLLLIIYHAYCGLILVVYEPAEVSLSFHKYRPHLPEDAAHNQLSEAKLNRYYLNIVALPNAMLQKLNYTGNKK